MAYQIKRATKIVENLELMGDDGNVEIVIHVDIDVDRIVRDYRAAQVALADAKRLCDNRADGAVQQFGAAVIELFNVVFGDENTAQMLDFFDGKHTEMCSQVLPFINDVINPAVVRAVNDRKSRIAANANLSRAQRRKIGL